MPFFGYVQLWLIKGEALHQKHFAWDYPVEKVPQDHMDRKVVLPLQFHDQPSAVGVDETKNINIHQSRTNRIKKLPTSLTKNHHKSKRWVYFNAITNDL